MSNNELIFVGILIVVLAFAIAKYQQHNGYKFTNSFIGALIGLIGLAAFIIKLFI